MVASPSTGILLTVHRLLAARQRRNVVVQSLHTLQLATLLVLTMAVPGLAMAVSGMVMAVSGMVMAVSGIAMAVSGMVMAVSGMTMVVLIDVV
jgi:hypothetical protein